MRTAYDKQNKRVNKFFEGANGFSDLTVTIIGLGGGGEIALHLLRSGVTKMNLIDFDILEEGNLVRHICGTEYIGLNKAIATKELLDRYSGIKDSDVVAHTKNIFDDHQGFVRTICRSSVVIAATDTDSSKHYINEVCVKNNVPAIFVGMHEDGCGGEVFASMPGMACYECLSHHNGRTQFIEKYNKSLSKKDCSSARDTEGMPGLGIDQSFLCAITARKCLDILVAKAGGKSLPPLGKDWILWSLFGIKDIFPQHLTSYMENFQKHPNCSLCGS